jgi:hypothetical protein
MSTTVTSRPVSYTRCRKPHDPFIAPCRDPLRLWALHWYDGRLDCCWFRYYGDRAEARTALRAFKVDPAAFEKAVAS